MKRFSLTALRFLLLASLVTVVQASAPPGDDTRPVYIKGVSLAGTVSNDGKSLMTDDDNNWTISNADALREFKGLYVAVKCRMDLSKRAIRVLSVVEEQPAMKHAANLGDSAFRR